MFKIKFVLINSITVERRVLLLGGSIDEVIKLQRLVEYESDINFRNNLT